MIRRSFRKQRPKQAHPIPSSTDIDRIRRAIGANTRDLLLFNLSVETGVTANQLLSLYVKDLAGLKVGEEISVLSGKLGRKEPVVMGQQTHESFQQYLRANHPMADELLFKSRKGDGALSLPSASRLVRSWFDQVGLKGMSGFLSLRKTWEMHRQPSANGNSSPSASEPAYSAKVIQTPTTQELVYKELERAIVTARIKPGERLVTEELARQMGISRIPIREAIGRLEARNFVTVQPKKGTTVNELSERNLKEILEIRLMLECTAARKAAIEATTGTVGQLELQNKQYISAQQEKDADKTLSVNREFHFTIYRCAHMPILLSMIQNLWDQVSPYYHLMFRQTVFHDPQTGRDYHQKMIDALGEKDPQKVSKWLEIDLTESTEFVINVMRRIQAEEEIK